VNVTTAELVLDARASVGEGPVWDVTRRVLWWVDILGGMVHAFEPTSGLDRAMPIVPTVGSLALCADGNLLVAAQREIAILEPETGRWTPIVKFGTEWPERRSNDGKCDPAGCFWFGRMALDAAAGAGSLLRIDREGAATTVLAGLAIPNGLAWSLDARRMYFIDSSQGSVMEYPYEVDTGEIGPGHSLVRFADHDGAPDGMTIDTEGFLWVAVWGGSCVQRISPAGRLVDRIDLPVSQVSSCAFGGDELTDLYITTAREDFGPADIAREPTAGGLYRARPGVRGLPPVPFAGGRPSSEVGNPDAITPSTRSRTEMRVLPRRALAGEESGARSAMREVDVNGIPGAIEA
jgi:sugar lactone lactonase YvrE